jgi:hypothetical protein
VKFLVRYTFHHKCYSTSHASITCYIFTQSFLQKSFASSSPSYPLLSTNTKNNAHIHYPLHLLLDLPPPRMSYLFPPSQTHKAPQTLLLQRLRGCRAIQNRARSRRYRYVATTHAFALTAAADEETQARPSLPKCTAACAARQKHVSPRAKTASGCEWAYVEDAACSRCGRLAGRSACLVKIDRT